MGDGHRGRRASRIGILTSPEGDAVGEGQSGEDGEEQSDFHHLGRVCREDCEGPPTNSRIYRRPRKCKKLSFDP